MITYCTRSACPVPSVRAPARRGGQNSERRVVICHDAARDAPPGLEASGQNFSAVKDIDTIMKALPHRCDSQQLWPDAPACQRVVDAQASIMPLPWLRQQLTRLLADKLVATG